MNAFAAYLDAVSDALTDAGIGVRGNGADTAKQMLAVDLEALPDGGLPVIVWSPGTGWRIGVSLRGKVRGDTIRYVHAGPVPSPAYVAESVGRWLARPTALSDVEPVYEVPSRLQLEKALAAAAGSVEDDADVEEPSPVRELAAAIRDALTVPNPAPDAWHDRNELLGMRAAHVTGVMRALVDDASVKAGIGIIRRAVDEHPATYPTRDPQNGEGQ